MKLFGRQLFTFKKPAEQLYDFAQHGLLKSDNGPGFFVMQTPNGSVAQQVEKKKPEISLTPKALFEMKALNARAFGINADADYLTKQVGEIKTKLTFLGKPKKNKKDRYGNTLSFENGGVVYGRMELESILQRLQNRLKVGEWKDMLEKYPHTTSELINTVVHGHKNLQCKRAEEFIPDFPTEAIAAMEEYDAMCEKLCDKKAVFYVIADEKDFEVKNKRRDPILLAQSPFGHFWQILGAWDKEMMYLADL